jgi:predicted  nucleic acid-binding Zn-ribbon protein
MDSTADSELEMIRADAHQTRAALADKLEALESQVSQTVAGVTSAVETVSNSVAGVKENGERKRVKK